MNDAIVAFVVFMAFTLITGECVAQEKIKYCTNGEDIITIRAGFPCPSGFYEA